MSRVNSSIKEGKFNDLTGEFVFDVKNTQKLLVCLTLVLPEKYPFMIFMV
jgi:hypothetical protein